MTVTQYWEARPASPMQAVAMKISVFATSGADIERLFSQARAAFDYFMGSCKMGTMSDRLFVKIIGAAAGPLGQAGCLVEKRYWNLAQALDS